MVASATFSTENIPGEAQFCQNVANGVTNGVGQATDAALTNTATTISKTSKLRLRLYRRQGTGAADGKFQSFGD